MSGAFSTSFLLRKGRRNTQPLPHLDGGMVRHWGASSLAEHVVPAELNANIRLEPGKHELTAEEIAAAKADTAAIANGHGLCLVGVPGGRFRPLQSGQLCDARDPV